MTECTAPDCENPTDLYLCTQCVSDLQQWIDKIPDLIDDLYVTMARQDKVRKASTEGGSGRTTGSAAPINFDAWQLRENLSTITLTAQAYAHDQWAAGIAWTIQDWVTKAEELVLGEAETRVITTCDCGGKVISKAPAPQATERDQFPSDAGKCVECKRQYITNPQKTRGRILERCPDALSTREALKWIADNAGISVAPTDVRNWAREKKIKRANPEGKERPKYLVSDILAIHFRNADTGKRKTQRV